MQFTEITDHSILTHFYAENKLEISNDWANSSGVFLSEFVIKEDNQKYIKTDKEILMLCNKNEETPNLVISPIAAYSLSKRYGVIILEYIAVKSDQRKNGIGSLILKRIKEKCKEFGSDKVYLNAKAIDFFRKNGACEVPCNSQIYLKLLGDCTDCMQRNKNCHPYVMYINI